jgi:hypothetical protein
MDFANPSDASLNASAETVAFLSDGSFVVGGGVNSSIAVGDMHFKSGGNVEESSAWMGQISASDAAGSSAPTAFAWQWTTSDGRQGNVKSIRVDSSDNIIGVAGIGSQATVYKLNSSGTEQWNTGTTYNGSQFSDLTINTDGTLAFAGLAAVGNTYYGRLVGADSTGAQTFSVDYGNYGGGVGSYDGLTAADGDWIYNECWGIAKTYATDGTTHDGYILACGTGIECENGSANVSQCTTDYRKNWRALLVATDLSGNRVWSRMDNVSLGDGVATQSSASEFVFSLRNGGHAQITDEAQGFGWAVVAAYDGTACTATTTFQSGSNAASFAISLATFGVITANLF